MAINVPIPRPLRWRNGNFLTTVPTEFAAILPVLGIVGLVASVRLGEQFTLDLGSA